MSDFRSTEYLPIAYLPGASGRAAVWKPVAQLLAHRRAAVLLEYPGLSGAARRENIHCLADLAEWVVTELPDRCDLISISVGSALALRLALEHPARIRRLVLVVPCAGVNARRFGALDWRESFMEDRPHAPRWFVEDTSDFSDRLSALAAPTLIVCGGQDRIAPPAIGHFLQKALATAKLEILPTASHDLDEEHPALLASLIEAHLRR